MRMSIVVQGAQAKFTQIEGESRNKFEELESHLQITYNEAIKTFTELDEPEREQLQRR